MKVILRQTIAKVGKSGQVANVADGFARNFLFPRGLAIPATRENLSRLEKEQAALEAEAAKTADQARAKAERIDGKTIRLTAKTAPGQTKMFGSITPAEIVEALKNEFAVEIERHQVALLHPIRRLGVYDILIDLHRDVDAHIRLEVADEHGWLGLPQTEDRGAKEQPNEEIAEAPASESEEGTAATDGE
jgi:large subunit ribosomal protein L9